MKKIMLLAPLIVLLTLIGFSVPAFSQTMTVGTVDMIRTGWDSDTFGIVTKEPIKNPAGCPTADGYVTDKTLPGYNTYYAAALTAFLDHAQIVVVIANQGCVAGRPKLIGVNLQR